MCVEADLEECIRVICKRPTSVRLVGVHRSRLVATCADDVEVLHAATSQLELVKFFLSNAAARSRRGNARKVMLIDIGMAQFYAAIEESSTSTWLQNEQAGKRTRSFFLFYALAATNCHQQLEEK